MVYFTVQYSNHCDSGCCRCCVSFMHDFFYIAKFVSIEANVDKKFEKKKRDTRVHIIEAIKSLKAAIEERFEKSEHNARGHISEAIKSLEETLAENSIKSKQYKISSSATSLNH